MCLAIPGKIVETFIQDNLKMGRVSFAGIKRAVCLEYVPQAAVDDFVLVHVGFAISIIDQIEAERALSLLKVNGELAEELGEPVVKQ
jgi:hydrogenase expression/formation protein HypC